MLVLNEPEKLELLKTELKKSKVIEAPFQQTKSCIRHCDENKYEKYFYKYLNFNKSQSKNNLNQANYSFYSINEENFCLYRFDEEKIFFSLIPQDPDKIKGFELMKNYSNLYCSHIFLNEYIVINFEQYLLILRDETIIAFIIEEKFKSKQIMLLKQSFEYSLIGFYDNQMNLIFAELNMSLLNEAYKLKSIKDPDKEYLISQEKMDIVDEIKEDNNLKIKFSYYVENLNSTNLITILNEYDNGSNYCMDSVFIKSRESTTFNPGRVLAICGERGKSKVIQFENAFQEVRLANFHYNQIREAILVDSFKSEKILFLNTLNDSKPFYFELKNGQINFYDLNVKSFLLFEHNQVKSEIEIQKTLDAFYLLDNKTIIQITNTNFFAFTLQDKDNINIKNNEKELFLLEKVSFRENKMKPTHLFSSLQEFFFNLFIEDNDIMIISAKHLYSPNHNCFFVILIFSNFKISILKLNFNTTTNIDNIFFQEESTMDYLTTVSAFDIMISNDKLLILTGTYDSKLEILSFEICSKKFYKKSEYFLEAENSDIVPESIKITNNNSLVFISTRIGKFVIFSLDTTNISLNFLGSFNPKNDEIEPIIISDCVNKEGNNYELTLYSNNNSYILELHFSEDGKNMNSRLNKLLVENKISDLNMSEKVYKEKGEKLIMSNTINFFLNIKMFKNNKQDFSTISIFQNHNLICFSHFQKVIENSLLINNLKYFENNVLAKKILPLNESNICVLYNKTEDQILKWGFLILNIIDLKERIYEIEMQRDLKINVMKTIDVEFDNLEYSEKENKFKYLLIGGEIIETSQSKKGIFYIYKIEVLKNDYVHIDYLKKYTIGHPINDFCQLNNNIIFTCNNNIYSTLIEIDNLNRNIEIIPKSVRPHMNKLISSEAIKNSNYLIVGDVTESFNLLEYDTKLFNFDVAGAELSLKCLYKGYF